MMDGVIFYIGSVNIMSFDSKKPKFDKDKKYPQKRPGIRLWRTPDPDTGEFPELDEAKLKRLREKAQNYCFWALSQSDKTRAELEQKMKAKNCPEDILVETLDKMEELGYLSDQRFAESFVYNSTVLRKKGKRRVEQDLRRKGVSSEIIEEAVASTSPEEERVRAVEIVEKKLRGTAKLEPRKRKERLAGYLIRNGYDFGMAFSVVDEVLMAEGEERDDSDLLVD